MLYIIYAIDIEDSLDIRLAARPEHLARLKQLKSQGRLELAGPMPAIDDPEPADAGFCGSVIVAEFKSLLEAQEWIKADPYTKAGVYKEVNVEPFKKVLP